MSHQPAATKHTGPHCAGARVAGILANHWRIPDAFNVSKYSFFVKPADSVNWESISFGCFWRDFPLKCFDVS